MVMEMQRNICNLVILLELTLTNPLYNHLDFLEYSFFIFCFSNKHVSSVPCTWNCKGHIRGLFFLFMHLHFACLDVNKLVEIMADPSLLVEKKSLGNQMGILDQSKHSIRGETLFSMFFDDMAWSSDRDL